MSETHHSEYGRINSIYLKHPIAAWKSQSAIDDQWEQHHYLGEPDYEGALKEYGAFEKMINEMGAAVSYFEADDLTSMDSVYCRDASITTDFGVILCRMGKQDRANEPEACLSTYRNDDIPILGRIEAPGTIEGGDVAWIDTKTLAVGRTYRTNDDGIAQLKSLLNPHGIEVKTVELPHYKGKSDVFHLMSILSPVDKDLAVVYSPLMPITFREYLLDKGYQLVEVPDEEFESMGCNVLALSPRTCLMVDGNPITKSRLEAAGATVHTYQGTEISVKGGGGPTCLTRPFLRLH
ncbi:MAG: arginine deiminase family protein [Cyclobacteriaceae bacterium]